MAVVERSWMILQRLLELLHKFMVGALVEYFRQCAA